MKKRKNIQLDWTTKDLVLEFCEGNPGAINVLMNIITNDPENGIGTILALDAINMRGSQLWVAFKDFAGGDLEKLKEAALTRNKDMISMVNKECADHVASVFGRDQ